MRHDFQIRRPVVADKIKLYTGNANLQPYKNAMHHIDYIFREAAFKHVLSCELFPIEAVKTIVAHRRKCACGSGTDDDLLYQLRQCDMFPRFCHSIIYRSDHEGNLITNLNTILFLMNLDEAVDLIMFVLEHGEPGELFVQKYDVSIIDNLLKAV